MCADNISIRLVHHYTLACVLLQGVSYVSKCEKMMTDYSTQVSRQATLASIYL